MTPAFNYEITLTNGKVYTVPAPDIRTTEDAEKSLHDLADLENQYILFRRSLLIRTNQIVSIEVKEATTKPETSENPVPASAPFPDLKSEDVIYNVFFYDGTYQESVTIGKIDISNETPDIYEFRTSKDGTVYYHGPEGFWYWYPNNIGYEMQLVSPPVPCPNNIYEVYYRDGTYSAVDKIRFNDLPSVYSYQLSPHGSIFTRDDSDQDIWIAK